MMRDNKQASCPYCGEAQSYDEARPSKPILSAPRQEWNRGGYRTVRDTTFHTHCRQCGKRLIWSRSFYPVAGIVEWLKVEGR